MKTALIDSSVWVSFYEKRTYFQEAQKIMEFVTLNRINILIPTIVYVEVINVLYKLKINPKTIREIKETFQAGKNIKIIHTPKTFWLERVAKYPQVVRLKSSDLIILAHALEFDVDYFYTFDKKLLNEYNNLKNIL